MKMHQKSYEKYESLLKDWSKRLDFLMKNTLFGNISSFSLRRHFFVEFWSEKFEMRTFGQHLKW